MPKHFDLGSEKGCHRPAPRDLQGRGTVKQGILWSKGENAEIAHLLHLIIEKSSGSGRAGVWRTQHLVMFHVEHRNL
jgi:hypothetical protein